MKAARLFTYDKPLKLVDVETPRLKNPADVIVRVTGAGVCHTDLHIVEGVWKEKVQVSLPYTLGHENAGIVEEVGSAVTSVKKGEKVILHPVITDGLCRACRIGEDMHCENLVFPGITADGGFAQFIRTSDRSLVRLNELEPADVAPLADAGLTAIRAVKKAASRTTSGSNVVVLGYGGNANLKAIDMIFSEFSVLGSLVGNWDELRELIELTRQGKVRVITRKGKLDEVNDMLDQLKKGTLEGRGVVIP